MKQHPPSPTDLMVRGAGRLARASRTMAPGAGGACGHPSRRRFAPPLDEGRGVWQLEIKRARRGEMNLQLFTAFLLITVVLILMPRPIVTLVVATSVTMGVRDTPANGRRQTCFARNVSKYT